MIFMEICCIYFQERFLLQESLDFLNSGMYTVIVQRDPTTKEGKVKHISIREWKEY